MVDLEKLEQRVLVIIQQDFPISSHPYKVLGEALGATESEAFDAVQSLCDKGIIRRLGGSFDSRKVGYKSTLAALSVPEDRLDEVVAIVNSYPGVTHNYEREENYNVWFTLIAPSNEAIESTIEEIEERTGTHVLNLPATHIFKIKVNFDLGSDDE
jgi:DNA-binding Lrp family transcriptional regulator